ncbi:MAG TPA: hypothetical protein VFK89_01775 [Actinomycetota bacterium]|nr:hypothetical protein [Actinomycetota bacterium]
MARAQDAGSIDFNGRDQRNEGVIIDLERLEQQADSLYLHRFVEYVKKVRGEHGRYLTLRAGDTLAIKAADDGSAETLEDLVVEDGAPDA